MRTQEQVKAFENELMPLIENESWQFNPEIEKKVASLRWCLGAANYNGRSYEAIKVWVFYPNGKKEVFDRKTYAAKALGINYYTIMNYLDTDKPVNIGPAKGCYFYSLPKVDE